MQPLVWGSHYQLTVSDTVRSSAGGKLTAGGNVSFDTRMPTWGAAAAIASTGPYIASLKSGGAANGDTIVLWEDTPQFGASPRIVASRYSAGTQQWNAPASIQGNSNRADSPDLSVSSEGRAAAVWNEEQSDGSYAVKVARFDPATGWSSAVMLSKAGLTTQFSQPSVAIANNGNIIATWNQYYNRDVNKTTIEAAYYDAASQQWSATRSMQNQTASYFPVAAIAANGNAMLLWSDESASPGVLRAYAARYDAASKSWSASSALQANPGNITYPMRLVIDGGNNAFAVLKEDSSVGGHLYTARYSAASNSWAKAEDMQSGDAGSPQIGVDAGGNALLIWSQYQTNGDTIQSRRYQQSANVWSALPTLGNYVSSINMPMQVDRAGNMVTAWVIYEDNAYKLRTTRYSAFSGKWDTLQTIVSRSGFIGDPVLSIDQSGQAMMVWPNHVDVFQSASTLAYARLIGK